MRKLFYKSLAVLFGILLALLPAELVVRYYGAGGTWETARKYTGNFQFQGCHFSDTITPHPFLAFVFDSRSECAPKNVNNRGFISKHDIPAQRDPNFFSILVLGGSVSSELAEGHGGKIWLEEILNKKFISPNGKPFRVISASVPSWVAPAPLIALTLFGDRVDAAFTVDGFNESLRVLAHEAVEKPHTTNYLLSVKPLWGLTVVGTISILQKWRSFSNGMPLLRDSHLNMFLWQKLLSAIDPTRFASLQEQAVGQFFNFPREWTRDKRPLWNQTRYGNFVRQTAAAASGIKIKYAHFLQPIPLIDKPLTSEERTNFQPGSREVYENIFIPELQNLRSKGLPVFSLVDVFKNTSETIYTDYIHCNNLGYELMSEKIAQNLAQSWNLKSTFRD